MHPQASLEPAMWCRLALNLCLNLCCLSLPSARLIRIGHHTQLGGMKANLGRFTEQTEELYNVFSCTFVARPHCVLVS